MAGDSKNNPTDGNLLLPDQVAGAVSESVGRNLGRSPDVRLLTSTSCGDIFRFRTERLARSHLRIGRRKGLETCDFQSDYRRAFAFRAE
jgi:hypothetical protein